MSLNEILKQIIKSKIEELKLLLKDDDGRIKKLITALNKILEKEMIESKEIKNLINKEIKSPITGDLYGKIIVGLMELAQDLEKTEKYFTGPSPEKTLSESEYYQTYLKEDFKHFFLLINEIGELLSKEKMLGYLRNYFWDYQIEIQGTMQKGYLTLNELNKFLEHDFLTMLITANDDLRNKKLTTILEAVSRLKETIKKTNKKNILRIDNNMVIVKEIAAHNKRKLEQHKSKPAKKQVLNTPMLIKQYGVLISKIQKQLIALVEQYKIDKNIMHEEDYGTLVKSILPDLNSYIQRLEKTVANDNFDITLFYNEVLNQIRNFAEKITNLTLQGYLNELTEIHGSFNLGSNKVEGMLLGANEIPIELTDEKLMALLWNLNEQCLLLEDKNFSAEVGLWLASNTICNAAFDIFKTNFEINKPKLIELNKEAVAEISWLIPQIENLLPGNKNTSSYGNLIKSLGVNADLQTTAENISSQNLNVNSLSQTQEEDDFLMAQSMQDEEYRQSIEDEEKHSVEGPGCSQQ